MPRAPSEEPEGLVLRPDLLSADDEAALLEHLSALRFDPIVMHGQAARRTARHQALASRSRYWITFRTLRDGGAGGGASKA